MFVTIAVVLWKILNIGYSQNFFKEESSKADFESSPESLLRLQISPQRPGFLEKNHSICQYDLHLSFAFKISLHYSVCITEAI